jgi:hypothetical protein
MIQGYTRQLVAAAAAAAGTLPHPLLLQLLLLLLPPIRVKEQLAAIPTFQKRRMLQLLVHQGIIPIDIDITVKNGKMVLLLLPLLLPTR